MSLDLAVAAIRSRAESLWPGIDTAPLTWSNEHFDRPTNGNGTAAEFIFVEVRWGGGGFESVGSPGSNLARRLGHIWLYAFIPRGIGENRAHQLVARAASMFEGYDFAGIDCQAMEPGGEIDSEDGAYFGQSAAIPFDYDETA